MWTGVGVSSVLFGLSIATMQNATVKWPAQLGLLEYAPWTYWLGFFVVLSLVLMIVVAEEEPSPLLSIGIVVMVGLMTLGLPAFVEGNARNPDNYQSFVGVRALIGAGRTVAGGDGILGYYQYWPGSLIILAATQALLGVGDYIQIVRYIPLFWVVVVSVASHAIGLRLGLSRNGALTLSVLTLASSVGWTNYPSMVLGVGLYLVLGLLLLSQRRVASDWVAGAMLMLGVAMTHPLAMVAAFLVGVGFVIGGVGSIAPVMLLAVVGAGWNAYHSLTFYDFYFGEIRRHWIAFVSASLSPETYAAVEVSAARLISRYCLLAFLVVYALLSLRHIVVLWLQRRPGGVRPETRGIFLAHILVWITPLGSPFAVEFTFRVVVLLAVWTMGLLLMMRPRRLTVACLVILLPIMLLFLQESRAGAWDVVSEGSLRGARFVASRVVPPAPPDYVFAHQAVAKLVVFYNPKFLNVSWAVSMGLGTGDVRHRDLSFLDRAGYVILNKQGHEMMLWWAGYDPYDSWPSRAGGLWADRVYDSEQFRVFRRDRPSED